jgi:hypothetical protein
MQRIRKNASTEGIIMKKYLSIREFMDGSYKEEEKVINRLISHLKRNRIAYQIVGTSIIIFTAGGFDLTGYASTGIDVGAEKLYQQLMKIGKWVIVFKGGWDTIHSTVQGDFESAKKRFLSYLLIYLILLGLPWALGQVDTLFHDMAAGNGK